MATLPFFCELIVALWLEGSKPNRRLVVAIARGAGARMRTDAAFELYARARRCVCLIRRKRPLAPRAGVDGLAIAILRAIERVEAGQGRGCVTRVRRALRAAGVQFRDTALSTVLRGRRRGFVRLSAAARERQTALRRRSHKRRKAA